MDQKLIEAVALSITDSEAAGSITLSAARVIAGNALEAVNASGTHWIAPAEPTEAMCDAGDEVYVWPSELRTTTAGVYRAMRDAWPEWWVAE